MRFVPYLVLAIILIGGLVFRLREIGITTVQPDEAWSLVLSTGRGSVHLQVPEGQILADFPETTTMVHAKPWYTIPMTLVDITHPPLYYTSLGLVRTVFSSSERVARLYSVLCGLGSIGVLYFALRRLASVEFALWTCALLAFSRTHIELSIDIRPYGLLLLGFSMALLGFTQLLKEQRGAGLLAAGVTVLLFTHYFAVGAVVALLVLSVWFVPRTHRTKAVLGIMLPVVGFGIIWGPFMWGQAGHGTFSANDPTTAFLRRELRSPGFTLLTLTDTPARLLMKTTPSAYPWAYASCLIFLTPLAVGRLRGEGQLNPAFILSVLTFGTLLAPLTLDLIRHSEHLLYPRYIILALPGCAALICALTLSDRFKVVGRVLAGSALLGTLLSTSSFYVDNRFDYASFVRHVEATAGAGVPMAFIGPPEATYGPREHLLMYSHFHQHARPVVVLTAPPPEAVLGQMPVVWVIDHFGSDCYQTLFPTYQITMSRSLWSLGTALQLKQKLPQ